MIFKKTTFLLFLILLVIPKGVNSEVEIYKKKIEDKIKSNYLNKFK